VVPSCPGVFRGTRTLGIGKFDEDLRAELTDLE
jgi:hypothetical protein